MKPILTIGMAHFGDFDGVYFTTQALRLYHDLQNVELLVIDNSPKTKSGEAVRGFVNSIPNARYIPDDTITGTSAPRNKVFQEATGEFVMCMDCHVLLIPDAIKRFKEWYQQNNDNADLITGPLIYDWMGEGAWATHFNLQWRAEMWGTWGLAWMCGCGKTFTIEQADDLCVIHDLIDFNTTYTECPSCGVSFPQISHCGHERVFLDNYKMLGHQDDDPFEIPAHGLGFFGCRKDAWLGFNPNFTGFGGEEGYIHIKYRQTGRKCLNLPFLGWMHRFGRVDGVPYPLQFYDRVRNYVIGHQELGLSLDPIHEHFVKSNVISEKQWSDLIGNPLSEPQKITQQIMNVPNDSTSPKISCVMATYRRKNCVERSIAMWVNQKYKDSELIIYNTDIRYPVILGKTLQGYNIKVVNCDQDSVTGNTYTDIGSVRRDALYHATGECCICWDDDDIFLPWNNQQCYDGIKERSIWAWKPKNSLWINAEKTIEFAENNMEASIIAKTEKIREVGFLADKNGGEHLSWLDTFKRAEQLYVEEKAIPAYAFNWSDPQHIGGHKQSSTIDRPDNFEYHKSNCRDVHDRPLHLIDISGIIKPYIAFLRKCQQDGLLDKGIAEYYLC